MQEAEIKNYTKLNALAEQGGIVIFGCGEDKNIPTCELCQAFAVEQKVYNRSFESISIKDALCVYKETIDALSPETVLLHIGEADVDFFAESSAEFDNKYRELIVYIKSQNKKCRIAIVSLKNYDSDTQIGEMNKHLKYIADSEQCEYGDIATKKVWNPKATMDAAFFVYSIGFVRNLKNKRPLYDLVKILFCYNA
ncbi:MAG: hypothetical protein IJZ15_00760 [Oscillospiraceae bacterium]|nr:hypothetical protein [Oscillospiraceae bacterium]